MLIRHSALYVAGKLLPGLMGAATTALLTRLLDPAAYGLYGLALVVMTFGSTLAFDWLGLATLRVAQGARDPAEVAGTVAALFGGLVVATGGAVLAAWAAGWIDGVAAPCVMAGLGLMWCYAGFELASRLQMAQFRPGAYLRMNVGRAVLSLLGAVGLAWSTRDPAWTAAGLALGTLGGTVLGGGVVRRPRFCPVLARRIVTFGLPLAASLGLASLAGSGVRGLLEMLGPAEALGLYTAAFLLVQNTLSVVAAGIASAGYSMAVRALEGGNVAAARQQVAENWMLLLAVLAPMAVGMALTAPGLAAALVGPGYVAGVATLTPWLAGAGLFAGLRAHGLDHVFQLGDRPARLTAVTGVAAGMAIGLTVILVPRLGATGAAVAAFVSTAGSCVMALVLGRRCWPVKLPALAAARVCVACVLMAGAVHATPGLLAQVAAGVASYAAGCVALDVLGVRARLLDWLLPRRVKYAPK